MPDEPQGDPDLEALAIKAPIDLPPGWKFPSVPELAEKAKAFAVRPIVQEWPWEVVRELTGEATETLVDGLIQAGDQCILTSPPKAGKSYMAMQLAMTLAVGKGRFLLKRWSVNKPRRVLYVSLEMTAPVMAARVRACEGLLAADPALVPNGQNLEFLFIGPEDESPNDDNSPLHHRVRIEEAISRHLPEFIVFDTLIQMHSTEENDNQAMSRVMKAVRRLCILPRDHPETGRRAGARIGHLLLHHNKKGKGADGKGGGVSDARGAGSIHSEVDLALTLNERGKGGKYLLSLSARSVNPGEPVMLRHQHTPMLHFVPVDDEQDVEPTSRDGFCKHMVLSTVRQLYAQFYADVPFEQPAVPEQEIDDAKYEGALMAALRHTTKGGSVSADRETIFKEASRMLDAQDHFPNLSPQNATPSDYTGKFVKPWSYLYDARVVIGKGKTRARVFELNWEYRKGLSWVDPYNAAKQSSLAARKQSEKKTPEKKAKRPKKERRDD